MFRRRFFSLVFAVCLWTSSANAQLENSQDDNAQVVEITLERALALARQGSPQLRPLRARVREAESQIEAAGVFPFNPQIMGAVGPRFGSGDPTIDWSVGAEQWFELGGQGGDREDVARAGALGERARMEDARRRLLLEVSRAFLSVLYWQQRVELAEESLRIAEDIQRVATRRHEVGESGGLDGSVAALFVVRVQARLSQAGAQRIRFASHLKSLVGIAPETPVLAAGDLAALAQPVDSTAMPSTAVPSGEGVDDRADLRALRADVQRSQAELELGEGGWVPNLALGASYSREEGDHIAVGTLTLELPLFNHGQGTIAVARASEERATAELAAARLSAASEVHTARQLVTALADAARQFQEDGLPVLERAQRQASMSFEAGAMPLGDLLVVRRELMRAKFDYVDLLLSAAVARAELNASLGGQP